MATNLTDWSPDIMPDIPILPIPALKKAIRDAAIDFCKRTLLWLYTLDRIDVVANTQVFDLDIPAGECGEIISIDDVKYKEDGADDDHFKTLDPISENQMDLHNSGSWKFITSTAPTHYFGDNNDKTHFALYPIPTEDSDEGLYVRVNLKPTVSCETLPDFLYTEHRDTIAFGALASLFMKRSMPWFDAQQAGINNVFFRAGCAEGKTSKIIGPTKRPMRVKMREFV